MVAHQGAELDLFLLKNGKRLGFEIKRTDAPSMTPSMRIAIKDLQNDIDDYLFEMERMHGLKLATEEMDTIIERCLSIAKKLAGYNA